MPRSTVLDLAQEEHAQMLAVLRRARYGYLLARHIPLSCGWARPGRSLLSSAARAPVCTGPYGPIARGPWAWSTTRTGGSPHRAHHRAASHILRRALVALLEAPPRTYGWCRTGWNALRWPRVSPDHRALVTFTASVARWLAIARHGA